MALPGRVVAVEDRCAALEAHVATKIDEMRADLASLRQLLTHLLEADADATELLGQLLRGSERRLEALEESLRRELVPGGPARLSGGTTES